MSHKHRQMSDNPGRFGSMLAAALIGAGSLAVMPGCESGGDPRFAAETYDEYTEALTNAVIGTPTGTILVDAVGAASDGGAAAAGGSRGAVDGGVAGAAGSRGTVDGGTRSTGGEAGGVGGMTGAGGAVDPGTPGSASWHFDDCSPASHFLIDSSGLGANAQQALNAACVPGIKGLGVQFRSAKDIVQVPDEPQFTVSQRVAVAAWVHPNTVNGDQPILIKRLGNQTSFSLGIHNGNIEMSVVLTTGKTFISRAPIAPGVWTHVGGMYDGTFVFLFINGQQFGQVFAGGALRNVFAPIRIGATTQTQRFDGIIDEVFLSTENISKDVITSLACVSIPSTFTISQDPAGPVGFGTQVHYDVQVSDNDVGGCAPRNYQMFFNSFERGISTFFETSNFQSASPGQSVDFRVAISGSEDAEPGSHQLAFEVFSSGLSFEVLNGVLDFQLEVPPCFVSKRQELMITTTSVVDDPVRTARFAGPSDSTGVWTLGHLLRDLAPTPADGPALALRLFQTWLTDQTVNGFTVAARPAAQQQIIDQWPKTATGELDLNQAPFQLLAIVNRIDLRDLSRGSAGQARFVFALNPQFFFFGQEFTVILEYNLPAKTDQDVTDWANLWHGLSSHPFPSEEYNVALEAITRKITSRNASPERVNGSNLLQLRTNDFVLAFFTRWELREFELAADTGFLRESTVKETPDLRFNNSQTLADFINQNAEAIKAVIPGAPSSTVPLQFQGNNFLAGSIFNDFIGWTAFGVADPEARFHMSINTCNGCHGPETNTNFLMIGPRSQGQEAPLSPFITGTSFFDFIDGQFRTLNDLARRQTDLSGLLCPPAPATTTSAPVVLGAP